MGQDKSEIPKQYDFYGGATLSVDKQDTNKGPADNSVAEWLSGEAKVKLQEALRKLDLDSIKISGKHLITFTLDELQLEKKKVKNELKSYDLQFARNFNRPPSRHEKEPMRHIYMYYKKLKQAIAKQQTIGASSMGN